MEFHFFCFEIARCQLNRDVCTYTSDLLHDAALSPVPKPAIEGLVGKHRKLRGGGEGEGPIKFTLPLPPSSPTTRETANTTSHHTEKLTGGGDRG